jgi:hypothetical protein
VPLHAHDSLVDIRAISISGCTEWADAISAQSCLCQFLSNHAEEEGPVAAAVFTWLVSSGAAQAIFSLATANVQHLQALPQALKNALDGARSSALQVFLSVVVFFGPFSCDESPVPFQLAELERRHREPVLSSNVSSAYFGCSYRFAMSTSSRFIRCT